MGIMLRDFHMGAGGAAAVTRVMDELPLNQAFAFAAWNMEANPFASVDRVGDGYVAQEAYETMNQ